MTGPQNNELRDRPTGELFRELSDETTTLVRQEIELSKAELGESSRPAGLGAGLFDGAGPVWSCRLCGSDDLHHRRAQRGHAAAGRPSAA